jgi:hypothetical protein
MIAAGLPVELVSVTGLRGSYTATVSASSAAVPPLHRGHRHLHVAAIAAVALSHHVFGG